MKSMFKKLYSMVNGRMLAVCALMATMLCGTACASGANLDNVAKPIVSLINSMMGPALAIVIAAGSLYCILLGVKFAKAEEPQEREKAKSHLKSAIIGFVLIFILILVLNIAKEPLIKWVESNTSGVDF